MGIYEAVATTDDGGVYRAVQSGPRHITITDDALAGIADIIEFSDEDTTSLAVDNLPPILVAWIFEMRRGLSVTSAALSLRG